jgi:hypothetical protein
VNFSITTAFDMRCGVTFVHVNDPPPAKAIGNNN